MSHSGFPNKGKFDDRSSRDKSFKPSQGNRTQIGSGSQSSSNGSSGNPRFQQRCYLCNQLGHIAKYCKQSKSKEKESSGSGSQKSSSVNSQVTMQPRKDGSDVNGSDNPCNFLYSDSDSSVDTVRVDDKGSKPQCSGTGRAHLRHNRHRCRYHHNGW